MAPKKGRGADFHIVDAITCRCLLFIQEGGSQSRSRTPDFLPGISVAETPRVIEPTYWSHHCCLRSPRWKPVDISTYLVRWLSCVYLAPFVALGSHQREIMCPLVQGEAIECLGLCGIVTASLDGNCANITVTGSGGTGFEWAKYWNQRASEVKLQKSRFVLCLLGATTNLLYQVQFAWIYQLKS